jgi:hypothetical protein
MMKLSTERNHLIKALKIVAYEMESDLVDLTRPRCKRVEEEGGTFIHMALQDTADIEPISNHHWIPLAPISSPDRSLVLEAFCGVVNMTNALFPGAMIIMPGIVPMAKYSLGYLIM